MPVCFPSVKRIAKIHLQKPVDFPLPGNSISVGAAASLTDNKCRTNGEEEETKITPSAVGVPKESDAHRERCRGRARGELGEGSK